ncbi:Tc toxin subunit A-related protein [Streptomyces chartreusis]
MVTDEVGAPAADVLVRAVDRDLRSAETLGEQRTDADGRYKVEYAATAGARAETGRPDLQVVVPDPADPDGPPVVRSEVRFNAADRETVDLVLPAGRRGRSEYERHLARLEPVLDGVPLAGLREDETYQDITFLAAETAIPREHIEWLARAAAAIRRQDKVPAEAFYAWFRAGLPTDADAVLALPPTDLLVVLKRAVGENTVPRRIVELFDDLDEWLHSRRADALLDPAREGQKATIGDVVRLAGEANGLTPEQQNLLATAIARSPADGTGIAASVAQLGITTSQLRALRSGVALRHISSADPALMRAAAERLPDLSDGCAELPYAAVAALTAEEWAQAVSTAAPDLDADTAAARGAACHEAVAQLFPQDVLLAPAGRRPDRGRLATLIRRGGAALTDLVKGFPGLRLDTVLAADTSVKAKAAELDRRLGMLAAMYARNADVPVLDLDYLPDGDAANRLDLTGLDDSDRVLVLDTLKAMRRIYGVTWNAADGQAVLRAGYTSAVALAGIPADRLAAQTGLTAVFAQRITAAAVGQATETALRFFAAVDATRSPRFGSLAQGKSAPPATEIGTYFTRIPGYRDLFGEQAYCACQPCRSMLSPAAYLVDLLRFVQRRIAQVAFAGRPDDYPLRLRNRRPDLWTLPLSCANTDNLVPYLDIVNSVLETHVRGALGGADREAVYRTLARAVASASQPFHLHLERAVGYLGCLDRSRVEVAEALGADAVTVARASLCASVTEWDLLVRPRAGDPAFLERIFGPAVRGLTLTARIDVQELLDASGWPRALLDGLLATVFVRGADRPVIRAGKRDESSVQNDVEWLTGLTYGVLDRMHRMWRLSRTTGLPLAGLDLMLGTAPETGADDSARMVAVDTLHRISRRLRIPVDEACALVGPVPAIPLDSEQPSLFDRLFNLEPFAAQQGRWPQAPPVTFVHPAFTVRGTSTPDNRTLQRLTAGLGVSDAELVTLLGVLGLATAQAPSVTLTADALALLFRHAALARALGVSVADLGRLLRLASVGSVDIGSPENPRLANRVRSLEDLVALIAAVDDLRALRIALDDAQFVIEGTGIAGRHPMPDVLTRTMTERLARERPWEFSDTVLTQVPGIAEEDSRRILAANVATAASDDPANRPLERVPDSSLLRLRAAADPTASGFTLTLPPDMKFKKLPNGVTATTLAAVLTAFDPIGHVLTAVATVLGRSPASLRELLRINGPAGATSRPFDTDRVAIVTAAYSADPAALRAAALDPRLMLLRTATLFDGPGWDDAAVRLVADDRASATPVGVVFSGTGVKLTWSSFVAARAVDSLSTQAPSTSATTAPGQAVPDRAALLRLLATTDWSTAKAVADLAAALGTDTGRITTLQPHVTTTSAPPTERLRRLRAALQLANALGVSGETLRTIVPVPEPDGLAPANLDASAHAEFTALGQGADALYGVLRTRYADETEFTARMEPFEGAARGRRRDALVDFVLRPGDTPVSVRFASRSELYGYFLLDVEMGGCARASRIVAATQSVQLYVHRVLMGLEPEMWSTSTAAKRDEALAAVRAEWPWRQHYRVWEANRRIFLAPESYLEPDLRDDRTPLFDDVVEELMQEELSDDTATTVYTHYLEGFDELARLRVAGAFHDTDGGIDQLHLLAATTSDPPEYYHRAITGLWTPSDSDGTPRPVFGPWRKTGIRAAATQVTPAVIGGQLRVFWLESAARPVTRFSNGDSLFDGYNHQITVRFSTALATGRWSGPQQLTLLDTAGEPAPVLRDPLVEDLSTGERLRIPKFAYQLGLRRPHWEPVEGYRLSGPLLPLVSLDVYTGGTSALNALVADRHYVLDLFRREAWALPPDPGRRATIPVDDVLCAANGELYAHAVTHDGFSTSSTLPHSLATDLAQRSRETSRSWQARLASLVAGPSRTVLVRRTVPWPATGRLSFAVVVETGDQPLLALTTDGTHRLCQLGTGLRGRLSRRLFDTGVPGLLATAFQESSAEPPLPVTPDPGRLVVAPPPPTRGRLDLDGPVGTYLREIWLELPYLIAGQLNARQRFSAAQRWYHFLFDPTSNGDPADPDRIWRYRGFRGATVQTLREALTSSEALAAYRADPFNPHAIARLRPGTHQRAVVLRYLDNLLDWGDALFTEFTRESLNEATMLYILAADILGPRPAEVGACDDGKSPPTYAEIERKLDDETADFLIELELFDRPTAPLANRHFQLDKILFTEPVRGPLATPTAAVDTTETDFAEPASSADPIVATVGGSLWRRTGGTAFQPNPGREGPVAQTPITTSGIPVSPLASSIGADSRGRRPLGPDTLIPFDYAQNPPWWQRHPASSIRDITRPHVLDLLEQATTKRPVFCLPPNRELHGHWDRVEDRLHKIRNCMDLTGARRQPALFEPEIDPLLLARARAAGISIEDALATSSGSVPPYRFSFLIDKARQYVQSVQAFGTALLGALERKDSEELARLRATQERNLLEMRTRLMEADIAAARETAAALERQREAVQHRGGHYAELRTNGLSPAERRQQATRHAASAGHLTASGIAASTAIASLLPNGGSPPAMTYGGIQFKGNLGAIATAASNLATGAEAASASFGIEATFQRRDQDWAFQQRLAELELRSLDRQIAAARIRQDIADRALEAHQRSIDQADDVLDLFEGKFTSLGRYTAHATRAHRLHREAFGTALEIARMAERAFAFERGDDSGVTLAGGYWNAEDAGLGAADALLVDLQRLEQRFLAANRRQLEVEQSFSLAMLNPRALVELREKGQCSFSIPETAFDLTYPGHYRRRIKAVRVSLPCVAGPHVNVGATLRLTNSYVRREPRLTAALTPVPLRHTTAVATSSAQADPGVFEFNFRDERYLPFEGAGAVSEWQLELPVTFRTFNYRTISDVVLRVGYTAEEDATLRTHVEAAVDEVAGSLGQRLSTTGVPLLVSCRHDHPDVWRAVLDAAPGTPVQLRLSTGQLTGALAEWLTGRRSPEGTLPRLSLGSAALVLVTDGAAAGVQPDDSIISACLGKGTVEVLTFDSAPTGLYEAAVTGSAALTKPDDEAVLTLQVDDAGGLAPTEGTGTIDPKRLADVLILLKVTATAPHAP